MHVRFTNHSVSGTYRKYGNFALDIPGLRGGKPAVVEVNVPDNLFPNVKEYLNEKHPAITVENLDEADQAELERLAAEAEAAAIVAAEAAEAEKLAAEAAEAEAAAIVAAEAAEKAGKGKGGLKK